MIRVLLFLSLLIYNSSECSYLDYAASADVDKEALDTFINVSKLSGNSSGISEHSKKLLTIEQQAARVIAKKISAANGNQIIFTSSATISNNIAILGVAYKHPGCHLITSKIEHKSVINIFKNLEKRGYRVTYLNVNASGIVDLQQLESSINNNTKLISIQSFNSEIGVSQDIKSIGKIAKKYGVLFHSDASQSFCKYDINVGDASIDLLTISGYKIGAPKGIAALYVKNAKNLQNIVYGSTDELWPGTKPTALIASFSEAVSVFKFNRNIIASNYNTLKKEIEKISKVFINSRRPSHIFSVSIEGVLLKDILERMKNYSFSAGCSCLGLGESNVIAAIDPDEKLPTCTLRISFSDNVKPEELTLFAKTLKECVDNLRKEKQVGNGCSKQENDGALNNALEGMQSFLQGNNTTN